MYPIGQPQNKHDLVGPRPLIYEGPLAPECRLSSTVQLLEAVKSGLEPSIIRCLCHVYSYSDAPADKPLSRALTMIGVADSSLSAVRKLVFEEHLPPCLVKCTIAVKLADPKHSSHLKPEDVTNSNAFAKFMRQLRSENAVAVLGRDKYNRFGFLTPEAGVQEDSDSSYSAGEFAVACYIGNLDEVERFLAPDESSSSQEESPIAETSTGDLWQPPGSNQDDESTGGLWEPPAAEASDGMAWHPSSGSDQLSGQKRKFSDDGDKDTLFHSDTGAAAADEFYSGLTRDEGTRADSWLYHMRAFNGWVKATQIQELDPHTHVKGKKSRAPLRVLDLACGKGGDLGKWILHERGISNYVGVDVARGSLVDAAIRARKMKKLKRCTFICADLGSDVPGRLRSRRQKRMQALSSWSLQGESEYETGEPQFKMVRGGGISLNDKFDVVSIQFAIHYMMSSRTRARRFFQTVSELLETGGNLIITTIDARVVLDHLLGMGLNLHFNDNDGDLSDDDGQGALIEVGGGACKMKFGGDVVKKIFTAKDADSDSDGLFGLQYTFTLVEGSNHAAGVGDAVNLPEWLAPIPVLKGLAAEAGLELESAENFHEFYANRADPSLYPIAHTALYNMKVLDRNGSISPDEWEVSRLYVALKFRKVRESTMVLDDAGYDDEGSESESDGNAEEEVPPTLKAKLMPVAMMKAKKSVGISAWNALSSEEKTHLTEIEVRKMAASKIP